MLTVAHLDHTPENCEKNNLMALCSVCHLRYDAAHRKQKRIEKATKHQILLPKFGEGEKKKDKP